MSENTNALTANPFSDEVADESADVIVQVGKLKLHLHSFLLSRYSPVFCCMLKKDYREGQSKEIKLVGKEEEHMINFFVFFYQDLEPEITPLTDFSRLFELCEEYQVDWLSRKLERYLINSDCSERQVIVRLLLSEQFQLAALKDKFIKFNFIRPFEEIMKFPEFECLQRKTQIEIFKICLLNFLKLDRRPERDSFVEFFETVQLEDSNEN